MYHLGMNFSQISELPVDCLRDAWNTIERVVNLPPITMDEINALEIPEEQMYVSFRGNLNGIPSVGRVVRTREGVDISIDFRYDTSRLRECQRLIEQRFGHYLLSEYGDG